MGIPTISQTRELLPLPPLTSIWKDLRLLEVDWQDDPLHETEDFFVGLDQPIQLVVAQNNVHEEVAEEVEERRPSKRIRVTQKEMVKDEKPKKG
nr:hypothetical protein [Tanacetum cinerariifolium]